ncbi:MAG: PilZ domain-containing protein, partial [Sphingobium sp.]
MKLAIPRPRFLRRKEQFKRVYQRYDCALDTSLMMIDRMISFEGRLLDISRGGAMFRPKLAYIMHRAATPVCMPLGPEELFGQIISTSPKGFSIRFDDPLDEEDLIELLEQVGVLPA